MSMRVSRDPYRYVPAKLREYCYDAYHDSDGYWFEFRPDENGIIPIFNSTGCSSVHEDTISECRVALSDYVLMNWHDTDERW